jgi:hypothetical protein
MDPVAVLESAARALREGRWLDAANLCDAESLAGFREDMVQQFDPQARRGVGPATPEDYLRDSPAMPVEVAEYFAAQHRSRPSLTQQMRRQLPGIRSHTELAAASAATVFASWLHGQSVRYQVEYHIARGAIPPEALDAALAQAAAEYAVRVIGVVNEGELFSHVLFRTEPESGVADDEADATGSAVSQRRRAVQLAVADPPRIATCMAQPDGSWRLLAGYSFLGRPPGGWVAMIGFDAAEPDACQTFEAGLLTVILPSSRTTQARVKRDEPRGGDHG